MPRLWGKGVLASCDAATLDYIRSLGVDYVWFTGLPRHATGQPFVKGDPGSPYAVTDWLDINPYLAENPSERMAEFSAPCEPHSRRRPEISDGLYTQPRRP